MTVTRAADAFYTYRFLSIFTTKWTDMDAYKLGIIDENGSAIKKTSELRTQAEKDAFTLFHRLAFNLKRLLETLPLGRSRMANWVAALALIREHTGMSEDSLMELMKAMDVQVDGTIEESYLIFQDDNLSPGYYTLSVPVLHPKTGEVIGEAGSRVYVESDHTSPMTRLFDVPIYEAVHVQSGQKVLLSIVEIHR